MFKETVSTVDLSDHEVLMDCYMKLNAAFKKQKERIAELEKALDAFHKDPENPYAYSLRYKAIASKAINEQVELRERIAALEAALKPFAEMAQYCNDMSDSESHCVFAGDLRAARAAIEGK